MLSQTAKVIYGHVLRGACSFDFFTSILVATMISNFSTVTYYPFEMLQLVCSLGRFFVLLLVLLAESSIMAFNITRHTTGDVFENNNSSQSCSSSGAVCVFHGENQSTLCEKNCCYCVCGTRTPTYLLGEGNCSTEAYLMSVLNSTQGKQNMIICLRRLCQRVVQQLSCNDAQTPEVGLCRVTRQIIRSTTHCSWISAW